MLFRTQDKRRSFFHDLGLAALLSMAAGSVNSAGFFAFDVLTTNVTGHMALLANDLVAHNWQAAYMKAIWMSLFLLGAFVSSLIMQGFHNYPRLAHLVPLLIEISILGTTIYFGYHFYDYGSMLSQFLAGSLLFAMGLQNSLITIVSGSVIRTTHLTGLFTDLGINLARLVIPHKKQENSIINKKLLLLFTIALNFFIGGVTGGFLFASYLFLAFIFPLSILIMALIYDIATFPPLPELEKEI
ncbi:putative membrane protein [Bernardetia litoralis DSM 6794]|uniref:Putative membrane protein n=1 Tax=Bernardetia litoralis (strain ATCC 23117 / DSM 6794 / NBRC 15988 / NCIMB 1366 / Fx l1 / Sio-4) TaxID=880071 RepID=I4AM46_BERLS|nr:YoaK family protein [Bernardetia litoralis]AFM05031.1 putative membrane protein [Bernardetia litoralis DSM 6794]